MVNSSIILHGDDKEEIENVLIKHVNRSLELNVSTLTDLNHSDLYKYDLSEDDVNIEVVRALIKKLCFRPYKAPIILAIIRNSELMSPEIQNTLLKTLEEPPRFARIILVADRLDNFLPTVISRCKTYLINSSDHKKITEEDSVKIEELLNSNIVDKFKFAEEITSLKSRFEVGEFMSKLIQYLHAKLVREINDGDARKKTTDNINTATYCIRCIRRNVNKRVILEHLFLNLR